MVILHSLAVSVEQLCARAAGAPTTDHLRPSFCVICLAPARNARGVLQVVGHGVYARQVRGVSERTWIVIWVRRFLCLVCGHTMSRLPDWLHPWRWYAATVIVEALCRCCIFHESAREIGVRFGRPAEATTWRSLYRWRAQLLVSPTLWGWLGRRLGIREPAWSNAHARGYLERLLAEGRGRLRSAADLVAEVPAAVRRTLSDLVHDRKSGRCPGQFPPGKARQTVPGRERRGLPTEKDPRSRPP